MKFIFFVDKIISVKKKCIKYTLNGLFDEFYHKFVLKNRT